MNRSTENKAHSLAQSGSSLAQIESGCSNFSDNPRQDQLRKLDGASTKEIPKAGLPEGTPLLLRYGYEFISRECKSLKTDIFKSHLLFQPTIFMRGPDCARLFYDESLFQREHAAPARMTRTLTGSGGVQGLDDTDHRDRKRMFMSAFNADSVNRLNNIIKAEWLSSAERWSRKASVSLKTESEQTIFRGVAAWSGIKVKEDEVERLTALTVELFESPGKIAWGYFKGIVARHRLERWLASLIKKVRESSSPKPPTDALHQVALHRDRNGQWLPEKVAAVELLNVIRPTVAVARYVVFAALALNCYSQKLKSLSDPEYLRAFVQEVRRTTPFFPFAVARVRRTFCWNGYQFPKGTRTILDLYGTNHYESVWDNPYKFRPERFLEKRPDRFEFIPHGGGDYLTGHRCAGEAIAVELLSSAVSFLSQEIRYDVPPQDLTVKLNRFPAAPSDGFQISNVRLTDT
jgi:fatty-acid peroxygenase